MYILCHDRYIEHTFGYGQAKVEGEKEEINCVQGGLSKFKIIVDIIIQHYNTCKRIIYSLYSSLISL